jgi:hypothetical protein
LASSSLQAARPPCSTLCGIRQAPPPCVKGPSMTHFFLEDHPFFSSPLLCLSRRRTVPTPAALSRVPPRPSVPKSRVPESRPPLCPETRQLPESRVPKLANSRSPDSPRAQVSRSPVSRSPDPRFVPKLANSRSPDSRRAVPSPGALKSRVPESRPPLCPESR